MQVNAAQFEQFMKQIFLCIFIFHFKIKYKLRKVFYFFLTSLIVVISRTYQIGMSEEALRFLRRNLPPEKYSWHVTIFQQSQYPITCSRWYVSIGCVYIFWFHHCLTSKDSRTYNHIFSEIYRLSSWTIEHSKPINNRFQTSVNVT